MKRENTFWILSAAVLMILVIALYGAFRFRAHRQLLSAKKIILEKYAMTRDFAIEKKVNSSFYFANTLPAMIHANHPPGTQMKGVSWVELLRPVKLYGTRFRFRLNINFNTDGSIRSFYTDVNGDQVPDAAHPIPGVILYNRIHEELFFSIKPDGTISTAESDV